MGFGDLLSRLGHRLRGGRGGRRRGTAAGRAAASGPQAGAGGGVGTAGGAGGGVRTAADTGGFTSAARPGAGPG